MNDAPPSLKANFSWTLAGNVLYAAAQFVSLVLLAKLGSEALVGRYALGLAITAPVFFLVNLKLRQVQATDAKDEFRFADYLGMRCLSIPVGLATVMAVAFLAGYDLRLGCIIVAVGLSKAVESVHELAYGLMQRHEKMDWIARSKLLRGVALIVSFTASIAVLEDLLIAVLATVALWSTVAVLDLRACQRLLAATDGPAGSARPILDASVLRKLFRLALPLGFVTVMGSLEMNLPRYFIEHHHGEDMLGIYAAMAYLLVAGNTIIAALAHSAVPRMARYYAERQLRAFLSLSGQMIALAIGLGLAGIAVAWLIGGPLLTLLFSARYGEHADVFVWLMVAGAIMYTFAYLGTAANAMRRFRIQAPIHLLSLISVAIGCSLWVPEHGLHGAVAATILGAGIALVAYVGWAIHALLRPPFREAAKSREDS